MKKFGGMHYPVGEVHMIEWLKRNGQLVNGRVIYQWKKQVAVYDACKQYRTAVDIGAHVGTWSINMADAFEHVHAFEPVEEHRQCFEANVGPRENVTLHALALGARDGVVTITRDPQNSGASHVSATPGAVTVRMTTLDSFKLEEVDLIKMDVEGYEANVIAGARETILRCRPIICCEQKRDFATKFGVKATAATDALRELGMVQLREMGGDFIMGWAS